MLTITSTERSKLLTRTSNHTLVPGHRRKFRKIEKKDLLEVSLYTKTAWQPPRKAFMQAPLIQGIFEIFAKGPLHAFHHGPHKIFLPTPPNDLLPAALQDLDQGLHAKTSERSPQNLTTSEPHASIPHKFSYKRP
jgi:hypothetical protein